MHLQSHYDNQPATWPRGNTARCVFRVHCTDVLQGQARGSGDRVDQDPRHVQAAVHAIQCHSAAWTGGHGPRRKTIIQLHTCHIDRRPPTIEVFRGQKCSL